VALLSLLATAWEAVEWNRARAAANAIAELGAGRDIGPEQRFRAVPPVRLAYALLLGRREQFSDAQAVFADLSVLGDTAFRARVYYDLGNLYLRQALAETGQAKADRAASLAELAKESYRRSLRADPGFWDAKYNLEVATRLMPDFDPVGSGDEESDDEQARKLWTQVPGFPRGLP
jgi:mxaK protein